MRQRFLLLLATLSLLLCFAALIDPFVRRGKMDWFGVAVWRTENNIERRSELSVTTRHGVAMFSFGTVANRVGPNSATTGHIDRGTAADTSQDFRVSDSVMGRLGFGFQVRRRVHSPGYGPLWNVGHFLAVPLWFLAGVLVLPPLGFFFGPRLIRRRRLARGYCPTCGYDLRASSDRCPECGTAVRAAPAVR